MLIPPRLLPPAAAGLLRANSVFIVECNRIWALKQLGAVGPRQLEALFARAGARHDEALERLAGTGR